MTVTPSIKGGLIGAAVLSVVAIVVALSYNPMYTGTISFTNDHYWYLYIISFMISGVMAIYFSSPGIESAKSALSIGFFSGCVTALVPFIVFMIGFILHLNFVLESWIVPILYYYTIIVIGIAISAFSSVIFAYVSKNYQAVK